MTRRYYKNRSNRYDGPSGLFVVLFTSAMILTLLHDHDLSQNFGTYNIAKATDIIIGIAIFIVLMFGIQLWFRFRKWRQLKVLGIEGVDTMHPLEFEKYIAGILKKRGFDHIKLTEHYDLGVDIIARKESIIWGIQVKRYTGLVKAEAVRQVITALNHYHCDRAMVITNSVFSRPAKILAESNHCVLIDRDKLAALIIAANHTAT